MIYLASASPRRCELLQQLAIPFQQLITDIDETAKPHESPQQLVQRLAYEKAMAAQALAQHDYPILGADTIVVKDNQIYGKPQDAAQAADMLQNLSNRCHQVMTAIALIDGRQCQQALSVSQVCFAPLSETMIAAYVQTGEPLDKAGAYAIQGVAAAFIKELKGSYSGVMGLPLYETWQLLQNMQQPENVSRVL